MKSLSVLVLAATLLVPTSGWAASYAIDFKITNSKTYTSIDVRVDYTAATGGFAGTGATVSCSPNSALNAAMAFMDAESIKRLSGGTMQTNGMVGPAVLFTCTFDSTGGAPTTSNFTISIFDWTSDTTTNAPVVQISRIQAL